MGPVHYSGYMVLLLDSSFHFTKRNKTFNQYLYSLVCRMSIIPQNRYQRNTQGPKDSITQRPILSVSCSVHKQGTTSTTCRTRLWKWDGNQLGVSTAWIGIAAGLVRRRSSFRGSVIRPGTRRAVGLRPFFRN